MVRIALHLEYISAKPSKELDLLINLIKNELLQKWFSKILRLSLHLEYISAKPSKELDLLINLIKNELLQKWFSKILRLFMEGSTCNNWQL